MKFCPFCGSQKLEYIDFFDDRFSAKKKSFTEKEISALEILFLTIISVVVAMAIATIMTSNLSQGWYQW